MLVSIQKFVTILAVTFLTFTTACGEGVTIPTAVADKVTINPPRNGLVEAYTGMRTHFQVEVCASDPIVSPVIMGEIPNLTGNTVNSAGTSNTTRVAAASIVGVETVPASTRCSGGYLHITTVQLTGNQVGIAQGILFLKSDHRIKVEFVVHVRYDDGQKG